MNPKVLCREFIRHHPQTKLDPFNEGHSYSKSLGLKVRVTGISMVLP